MCKQAVSYTHLYSRPQELESELKDARAEKLRLALHHDPASHHVLMKGSTRETAARLSEILSIQKELEVRVGVCAWACACVRERACVLGGGVLAHLFSVHVAPS